MNDSPADTPADQPRRRSCGRPRTLHLGVRHRPVPGLRLAARARARAPHHAAQRGRGLAGDAVRGRQAGPRRPAALQEPGAPRRARARQGEDRHPGRAQGRADDASAQHRPAGPHPAAPPRLEGVHPAPGRRVRAARAGADGPPHRPVRREGERGPHPRLRVPAPHLRHLRPARRPARGPGRLPGLGGHDDPARRRAARRGRAVGEEDARLSRRTDPPQAGRTPATT